MPRCRFQAYTFFIIDYDSIFRFASKLRIPTCNYEKQLNNLLSMIVLTQLHLIIT